MKVCPRCKIEKSLDSFGLRSNGNRQPYCRQCNIEYHKEHYKKNKAVYISKAKNWRRKIVTLIQDYKSRTPCTDCGQIFHFCAMDFDHLRDKKFTISAMVNSYGRGLEAIMEEMAKCELVCSNCHRVRTFNRAKQL